MWNYMSYGPWTSVDEYQAWIEHMQSTKSNEYMYAIIDKKTGRPVGVCAYLRIDCQTSKSIEVGHLTFSNLMQRSVVSSECLIMMIRNAFKQVASFIIITIVIIIVINGLSKISTSLSLFCSWDTEELSGNAMC